MNDWTWPKPYLRRVMLMNTDPWPFPVGTPEGEPEETPKEKPVEVFQRTPLEKQPDPMDILKEIVDLHRRHW